MEWPGDDEVLAQLAADASAGDPLVLKGWRGAPLTGGYTDAAVWRVDLRLRGESGGRRNASYVVKLCRAREVATMRIVAEIGAATFPRLIASRLDTARPDDQQASLFASPFYPGRDLTFADPAPPKVAEDLARLHARFEARPPPPWAWRMDKTKVAQLHAGACAALARSARFAATTPDHAAWLARLTAIGSASPLIGLTESFPATLVHGDVHAGNIIASAGGRHTLIDWGNACWAPAMLDVANMVPLTSPAWSAYLAAYRTAGGAAPDAVLKRAWRWAQGVTALMYLPWIAEHRDDAARIIAQALDADAALAAPGPSRLP